MGQKQILMLAGIRPENLTQTHTFALSSNLIKTGRLRHKRRLGGGSNSKDRLIAMTKLPEKLNPKAVPLAEITNFSGIERTSSHWKRR